MRNVFECDLCGTSVRETSWEHNAAKLDISIYVSCLNPLGNITRNYQDSRLHLEEVCDPCRRHVAAAIRDAILVRKALAGKETA